jgi:hypothetical protein
MLENIIKLLELGFTKKEILKILGICCCLNPSFISSSTKPNFDSKCQTCGDK